MDTAWEASEAWEASRLAGLVHQAFQGPPELLVALVALVGRVLQVAQVALDLLVAQMGPAPQSGLARQCRASPGTREVL